VSSGLASTGTIALMTASPPWQLVVPVKGGPAAKTRLHPPTGVDRAELALALATDCLTACVAGMPRGRVHVVTADARVAQLATTLGARVVADPGGGLDAAVLAGRGAALAADPGAAVAVLLGDLPSLRAEDLRAALEAASAHERAVVPDADGTGTVLLTAGPGADLVPAFGQGSAARHEVAGHTRLELDLPRLRRDVDDDGALRAALALGVGAATGAVLSGRGYAAAMQASVHTFDEEDGSGSALLDDGREVTFSGEVFAASALRHLRPGQRVSIDLAGAGGPVSRLWIVGIGDDQTIG
jgi:2-phospho-L-lactate guanylyltransferase